MPSALPDSSRFPLFHWLDSCGAVSENDLHTRKRHLKVGESPKLRRDTFSAGLTLIPLFKVHPSQESGTSKIGTLLERCFCAFDGLVKRHQNRRTFPCVFDVDV